MLPLGSTLPSFSLPDGQGNTWHSQALVQSKGLLVVFMCNHCPFVKHIAPELARLGRELPQLEVGMVGINSNDVQAYPQDGPEAMLKEAVEQSYTFPYLYDEDQELAKKFRAACTPDFYLFTQTGNLFYRGQLDDSRPGSQVPVNGHDLRSALEALLSGKIFPEELQRPSLGCNIKWKLGNHPSYFGDPK